MYQSAALRLYFLYFPAMTVVLQQRKLFFCADGPESVFLWVFSTPSYTAENATTVLFLIVPFMPASFLRSYFCFRVSEGAGGSFPSPAAAASQRPLCSLRFGLAFSTRRDRGREGSSFCGPGKGSGGRERKRREAANVPAVKQVEWEGGRLAGKKMRLRLP